MLTAISGYYDGAHIVLDENVSMQIGQKVIITLDVGPASTPKKQVDLSKFMGRGAKMFQTDAGEFVKELRENDRL